MIELFDNAPVVDVDEAEYVRLLGYPRGHALADRARELADAAREWYARHGRPWVYAHGVDRLDVGGDAIRIGDATFHSARLARTLRDAAADRAVLVAVSAGPEIELAAHEAWRDERPDEYFFLEMFGSAVVEHLTTMTGARLCGWAEGEGLAVLPHYSPGYPEWDIAEQPRLLEVFARDELPGPLDVFETGMLRPKKSLLAVFGVTPLVERVRSLRGLVPCENCSYAGCQFRRAPYRRAAPPGDERRDADAAAGADATPAYATSLRALRRWSDERLTLAPHADGSIDARFRYEGSTCSNMGRPLAFDYLVTLGPRDEGYPIRAQHCRPAADVDGYQFMCEYIREGERLIEAIGSEAPLHGRRLDEVLAWDRPALGPGCFCEPEARLHKWGLVLETIHYALTNEARAGAAATP